jgi:hypothetical protein
MRRLRSTGITLSAYELGGGGFAAIRIAVQETLTHFFGRRVSGDLTNFADQVVRQRHARQGCTGLQLPMQCIGDIPQLDHL